MTPPAGTYAASPQAPYGPPPSGMYPGAIPAQRQAPIPEQLAPAKPPAAKKATGKIVAAALGGLVLGILIGSSGSKTVSPAPTASPTPAGAAAAPPAAQAPLAQSGTSESSGDSSGSTPAAAAAAPSGPLTTLSPGTYEVGAGDGQAMPGTYKSSGSDGSNAAGCYYSRLKHNDGSVGDILSNNISSGPSVFTIKPSDGYIEINGCTFTKK
jgi:hypothetical protein